MCVWCVCVCVTFVILADAEQYPHGRSQLVFDQLLNLHRNAVIIHYYYTKN